MPTSEEDWKEWRWVELDRNAMSTWEGQGDGSEELIVEVSWALCGWAFALAGGLPQISSAHKVTQATEGHWHQPAAHNMTHRPGYATNDLLCCHPTKPHLRRV